MSEHRTFDATTGGGDQPYPHDERETGWPIPEAEPSGLDALDRLREAVQEREAAPTPDLEAVPIPGLGWRLLCDPDFSYPQFRDWQKAGLPARQKAGKKPPNPLDMDRALTASLILVNTCVGVEMQRGDGTWVAVTNSHGVPISLKDPEFLAKFNVIDPLSLLRKLFTVPGKSADAPLMKAGDQLIAAAGYTEVDDEDADADPTD